MTDSTIAPAWLDRVTGWMNSPPLTPADLDGRVVAVDFWTYTCVNWMRTAPYLRAWNERYARHGLLVVGGSIPQAWDNIFRLERACQLQVTTLSCNTEIALPPRKIIEEASHLYQPGVRRKLGVLEWPALIRKLDSIDPSYRE